MPPPQAASLGSADGALRSTSLKETSPSVGATGKSSDSLVLMFQAWQPHESPLWAHSWLLCLLLPHQVYYFPLCSFLPVSISPIYIPVSPSGVSSWSRSGRVAFGMERGKVSRRQMPLAQTSWGPRPVPRGQVVSYSYGVTEHSLSFTESDLRGRQVPASLSFRAQVLTRVHLGREGVSCLGDQKTSGQRPRLNWVLEGEG